MADTECKEIETNMNTKDSSSLQLKSSTAKKLSANAPVFDVSRSPTLDPYAGPNGIRTQPCYVPPATIPPPATQPPQPQPQSQQPQQQQPPLPNTHQTQSSQQPPQPQQPQRQKQQPRQRQPQYPHTYDPHDPDRERRMYQKYQQNQMRPHPGHPPHAAHPQHQYPPMGHPKYPNYPYPINRNMQHQPPHRHAPMMNRPPYPPTPQQKETATNGAIKKETDSANHTNHREKYTQNHTHNHVAPNTDAQPPETESDAPDKTVKVQFKTFTNQKNARAVGSTMAYKHPSRSHYGQPEAKLRDPKFTNPSGLTHIQRWELLESAKRWLPGEGTFITWKSHRYLIGPPIHMGMNGHIHYCYKYPLPLEDTNEDANEENSDHADTKAKSKSKKNRKESPCVETLAAKIVPNTPAFAREIVILRALQHCENVTELYDVLESERTLISILELAQADVYNFFVGRGSTRHGWNLDKPAVREHFSKMVISNVVQGLDQMHKAQYLHCDLKSLNILLYIYVTDHSNRRGGVYIKGKLTDFGHSSHGTTRIAEKLFSNGMARVGTAGHVAPELFKEGTKCTAKIDIWSLGIVMFSMLVPGRLLFSEYTNIEALKRGYDRLNKMNPWSRDRPSWWTDFERLSPEARDLILWMTRYDPGSRPTCAEILKHPWFLIGKQGHREHYRPSLKYVDMLCSSSIAQE
eukprot:261000_1